MKKVKRTTVSTYTAGGIQYHTNMHGWRDELDVLFKQLKIKHYDPTKLEKDKLRGFRINQLPKTIINRQGKEIPVKQWHDLSHASDKKNFDRFVRIMKKVIAMDLDIVHNKIDFLTVFWDKGARLGSGTYSEIDHAYHLGLPVYVVATEEIPAWLCGMMTKIFNSLDELKEFLKEKYE